MSASLESLSTGEKNQYLATYNKNAMVASRDSQMLGCGQPRLRYTRLSLISHKSRGACRQTHAFKVLYSKEKTRMFGRHAHRHGNTQQGLGSCPSLIEPFSTHPAAQSTVPYCSENTQRTLSYMHGVRHPSSPALRRTRSTCPATVWSHRPWAAATCL